VPRWEPNARVRLIESALELFEEQGYDETGVAEIAQRAGLTKTTFFRHFPDKREVLFAGQEAHSELLAQAVADAPPHATPLQMVRSALEALAGSLAIAGIGVVMERFFLRRLHLQELPQALLTFGFLFIFSDLATLIWGTNPQTIPRPAIFSQSIAMGGFFYPSYRLFISAFGLIVAGLLWWIQEGETTINKLERWLQNDTVNRFADAREFLPKLFSSGGP